MRAAVVPLLAALLLAGCATFTCTPATIVVTDVRQEEQLRPRTESIRVNPVTGRPEEIRHAVVERSYWVRGGDDGWIPVDEATWRKAERGKPLAVCR
jgi:hypothetical protein